jgi:hypothetical protein
MLIAASLAAIVVTISAPADVKSSLVDRVTAEADAIWRAAGLTITWERQPTGAAPRTLHVVFGNERGNATSSMQPLGWIRFEADQPVPDVYLSYANAVSLLETSRDTIGLSHNMTVLERDTYLSRAMGRALAHELGHYLLASKAHTADGLMKANRTAAEFFSMDRRRFSVRPNEWRQIAARLDDLGRVASD